MRMSRRICGSTGVFGAGSFSFSKKHQFTDEGSGKWNIQFLESGTLQVYETAIVDIQLVGGGGSGSSRVSNEYYGGYCGGGGGGGGYTKTVSSYTLTPGTYTITIGAGGASVSASNAGKRGGTTSAFGYSAAGGYGGSTSNGGNGGSGGGYGAIYGIDKPAAGASNGGSVPTNAGWTTQYGGNGQGKTTRDFGTGTLRAGAGGGGGGYSYRPS